MIAGDVLETVKDTTHVYDWRGSGSGTLVKLPKGSRLIAIDQFPPAWWKVAVQSGRWRAVADPDLILYPDFFTHDYARVAGTCPEHLSLMVTKVRQATEWWRR